MTDITLNIKRIVVFRNTHGTDRIYLYTDLPSPFPPGVADQSPAFQTDTVRGGGEQYVRDNFGVEPEVVDITKMNKS